MRAVLIVPGLHGSPEGHWQTVLQDRSPLAYRVAQDDWTKPVLDRWLERLLASADANPGRDRDRPQPGMCSCRARRTSLSRHQDRRGIACRTCGCRCGESRVSGIATPRTDADEAIAVSEHGGRELQRSLHGAASRREPRASLGIGVHQFRRRRPHQHCVGLWIVARRGRPPERTGKQDTNNGRATSWTGRLRREADLCCQLMLADSGDSTTAVSILGTADKSVLVYSLTGRENTSPTGPCSTTRPR